MNYINFPGLLLVNTYGSQDNNIAECQYNDNHMQENVTEVYKCNKTVLPILLTLFKLISIK